MGRFNTDFITERWFIITGIVAIAILTVLLVVVSVQRNLQERKSTDSLFTKYADRRGLSEHERQILLSIANKVGLRRSEAIFTIAKAFEQGAARMIEESYAGHGGAEQSSQLKTELSFLREKLGFRKKPPSSIGSATRGQKLSSRQIPVGKKLHITRRIHRDSGDIETTVIENNDMEITVKLSIQVENAPGEQWRARYYYGSSVWEFDTSVVRCEGDILVLNHSDNVRFINRRRFLRVPVSRPAFIAHFPFEITPTASDIDQDDSTSGQSENDTFGDALRAPEFVRAVVTEFAGPGLRIKAPLEVKIGERVLVVFKLDEERPEDSIWPRRAGRVQRSRIVEDIGEVRHIRAMENGWSIAVELTGLSDADVDKLIRATNAASLRADADRRAVSEAAEASGTAEPTAVRGV